MNKTELIKILIKYYNTHKVAPRYTLSAGELGASPCIIRKSFGTWNQALTAASIPITVHTHSTIQTMCATCHVGISVTYKLFNSRPNHYCSRSCAATTNNALYPRRKSTKPKRPSPARPTIGRAVGPYTPIRYIHCNMCGIGKWVGKKNTTFPTTCSDKCFIASKKHNALNKHKIVYNGHEFDNKWESTLAQFLDKSTILWVVPTNAIPWVDSNGKWHKYYPDFFLPTFNLYVDPKNPLVIERQQEKLIEVSKHINLIYGNVKDLIAHITLLNSTH